mmetsp:Transcript_21219/g.81024  ORF Transcript_21219/g.81024 Transcript_21219/m.81024 type:complete len:251 (+) Transcript_21219:449-1201(+)
MAPPGGWFRTPGAGAGLASTADGDWAEPTAEVEHRARRKRRTMRTASLLRCCLSAGPVRIPAQRWHPRRDRRERPAPALRAPAVPSSLAPGAGPGCTLPEAPRRALSAAAEPRPLREGAASSIRSAAPQPGAAPQRQPAGHGVSWAANSASLRGPALSARDGPCETQHTSLLEVLACALPPAVPCAWAMRARAPLGSTTTRVRRRPQARATARSARAVTSSKRRKHGALVFHEGVGSFNDVAGSCCAALG